MFNTYNSRRAYYLPIERALDDLSELLPLLGLVIPGQDGSQIQYPSLRHDTFHKLGPSVTIQINRHDSLYPRPLFHTPPVPIPSEHPECPKTS
jgi:hypothetical protein